MSSEFASCSFARTDITVGLTFCTIEAKLGGPDRWAGCADPSAAAAAAKCGPGATTTIAATQAINAKPQSRDVRPDEPMKRMNIR
jgi:hypothetical protein